MTANLDGSRFEVIGMREAPKRREKDFVSLFNTIWYKDFPVVLGRERGIRRANWTTHIANVVKQCSDLMGFLTRFETGNRTDAVIERFDRRLWARVEWEWMQVYHQKVDEIAKLKKASNDCEISIFIRYSHKDNVFKSVNRIVELWQGCPKPLLVFLVTFAEVRDRSRVFETLQTYRVSDGKARKVREQPALPWQVSGSRWQVAP